MPHPQSRAKDGPGVWEWHLAPDLFNLDEEASALFGFGGRPAKVAPDALIEKIIADDRRRFRSVLQGAANGAPVACTVRADPGDGPPRAVELRGKVYPDDAGRPADVAGLCWHATAGTAGTRDPFPPRGGRYQSLLGAISSAVWTADLKGAFSEPQSPWKRLTAQPWEKHSGWGWMEAFHPEDRGRVQEVWERAVAEALEFHCEARIWSASSRTYRRSAVHAVRGEHEITGETAWLGTVIDLEEEMDAKGRLEAETARYRRLFELSPAGILIQDEEGTIVDVNTAYCQALGYHRDELVGKKIHDLAHEESAGEVERNLQRILGGQTLKHTIRGRHRSGRPCYFVLNETSIPLGDGQPGIVVVALDITEQKLVEKELEEANRELRSASLRAEQAASDAEEANRVKSSFLATVSHELRTPLNTVIGFADILADKIRDEEQVDYVKRIRTSGQQLHKLIDDLLDISKIEAGCADLASEEVDIHAILEEVFSMVQEVAKRKGLALEHDVSALEEPVVMGDESRLRQILLNLVGNAVKFTAEGGVNVTMNNFRMAEDDILTAVTVADTGIGIEPAALPNIFLPFGQADYSMSREYGGSGLGLAISKGLCELMGGEIDVESQPGTGATFSFTFHARPPAGPEPERKKPAKEEPFHHGSSRPPSIPEMSVLYVDDDATNRALALAMLKLDGHQPHVVESGQEALDFLREVGTKVDLVLLDIQMPRMDGYEVTRRIRSGDAGEEVTGIPIVAVTAHAMEENRRMAMESGMDGFLTKPFKRQHLWGALEELMAARGGLGARP